jgi:hypothetical protein
MELKIQRWKNERIKNRYFRCYRNGRKRIN